MDKFEKACNILNNESVKCTVLSKDTEILELIISEYSDIYIKECRVIKDCIINQGNITNILNNRFAIFNRLRVKDYLETIGLGSKLNLLRLTHGVSLSDCLWVRFEGESLQWKDINPFDRTHAFDINWLIDKGNVIYNLALPNYSTEGNFAKCWYTNNGVHRLVKCGTSGAYNAGLEPISEVMFTQIAEAIGYTDYVKYDYHYVDYANTEYKYKQSGLLNETIGYSDKRLCSICECIADENKALISARDLGLKSYRDCIRYARENTLNHIDLAKMLLCDCIGYNEDRHLGNIGFEYNPDTLEVTKVAPMYDNNLSLLCYWEDRIDLQDYISELRAKDGSTFSKLAEYVFDEYPLLFHKLRSADINLSSEIVINNRIDIINDVVNKNVNMLLTH